MSGLSIFISDYYLHISSPQSVESGISSHEPSVSSLNTAGEKLVTSSSGENTVDIQQDISELNERYSCYHVGYVSCDRRAARRILIQLHIAITGHSVMSHIQLYTTHDVRDFNATNVKSSW